MYISYIHYVYIMSISNIPVRQTELFNLTGSKKKNGRDVDGSLSLISS